jgi:hypothetical protein
MQMPGVYDAFFIPSTLGHYTFRLCGAITVTFIGESFSSPPSTFAALGPLDRYQIPVDAPDGAWA